MGNYQTNTRNGNGSSAHPFTPTKPVEPEGEWAVGRIKFYCTDRKFGFIRSDEGYDVLLHWKALKKSSVNERELFDDMPIRFKSKPVPGRSPEATIVRLVSND